MPEKKKFPRGCKVVGGMSCTNVPPPHSTYGHCLTCVDGSKAGTSRCRNVPDGQCPQGISLEDRS